MTIASQTSRNDYVGNGATSVYPYTFRIFANTDLRVTRVTTGGTETTLALNTDYTVSGVGDINGGNVTLVAGALTSGYGLTIRRVLPLIQETDIRNQGEFFPETHEDQFDKSVMMSQQQQDDLDRTLRLPETETDILTLPTVGNRASKILGFDANGDPLAYPLNTSLTSAAFIQMVPQASAPGAAVGKIYFDQVLGHLYVSEDGSTWAQIQTDSYIDLLPKTSAPALKAGRIYFNSTDQQFYCCKNGTTWSLMG